MVNPVIFQIVGFQNSGKTTFIKRVILELKKLQIRAVTIKHHGHGGKPTLPEEKDSYQHIEAGAVASLVEGDGRLILQAEKNEWALDEKLRLVNCFQPDVILIEGHKNEDFPKGVIVRRKEDLEQLLSLKNIKAVYYWDSSLIGTKKMPNGIEEYSIQDPNGYSWLVRLLINDIN